MRKWSLLVFISGLAAALAVVPWVGKMPARAEERKAEGEAAPGKSKRAQAFLEAFNKGDAKAVAEFWTPEGDYVDEVGHRYKGRTAIEKLYEKVFAARKGAKLSIIVTSARHVTPDVAIEDGITEVTEPDGGPPTAAAFSAVLVKKDGEWYFESVRESFVRPPSNADHFEDLAWLIGDWAGETKGESGTASYSWAENQNFIVSRFATTLNGIPVVGGTQWIGWDAIEKQVRSWTFYSGGGFGEAVWTKEGDRWTIKTTARLANGKKASATNVLTRRDADHLTWQVTELTVDGMSMPDPAPLKLKRVKPEQLEAGRP